MTQAPGRGKHVCLTHFRGCWIICALVQGRYNFSLAINCLTIGCHQSACNFHCQVHSIFIYPWTHTFSSDRKKSFSTGQAMNCMFPLKYIILQHIIQKNPLPQTKKKKTLKKIVIYFSLKTIFFYEGLLQRADWGKNASYSAIL